MSEASSTEYFPDRHLLFLSLPVLTDADWPEWAYEKAEDLKVTIDQIVEAEGLIKKENKTIAVRYHRSIIEDRIAYIAQSRTNPNLSVIQFLTGELVMINMSNENLADYIEYFILMPDMMEPEEQQAEPIKAPTKGQNKKIKKEKE